MAGEDVTVRRCFCDARLASMGNHTFRYSGSAGGWYLTDAPTRSMSKTAHFRAFIDRSEYDHVDHTGEPVIWQDCPWCGGLLPGSDP